MTTTRRDLLTTALTAAGAAATPRLADAEQSRDHTHEPEHQAVPSDPALRTRALESVLVARGLVERAGGFPSTSTVPATAKFRPGERVRARNINPAGHTRLPRYARGKQGTIERDHGVFVFNDSLVQGLGEKPQHLYSVRFTARELWGPESPAGDSVHLDLWDDHLERA